MNNKVEFVSIGGKQFSFDWNVTNKDCGVANSVKGLPVIDVNNEELANILIESKDYLLASDCDCAIYIGSKLPKHCIDGFQFECVVGKCLDEFFSPDN